MSLEEVKIKPLVFNPYSDLTCAITSAVVRRPASKKVLNERLKVWLEIHKTRKSNDDVPLENAGTTNHDADRWVWYKTIFPANQPSPLHLNYYWNGDSLTNLQTNGSPEPWTEVFLRGFAPSNAYTATITVKHGSANKISRRQRFILARFIDDVKTVVDGAGEMFDPANNRLKVMGRTFFYPVSSQPIFDGNVTMFSRVRIYRDREINSGTATAKSESQEVAFTPPHQGAQVDHVWDGFDQAGALQEPGIYRASLFNRFTVGTGIGEAQEHIENFPEVEIGHANLKIHFRVFAGTVTSPTFSGGVMANYPPTITHMQDAEFLVLPFEHDLVASELLEALASADFVFTLTHGGDAPKEAPDTAYIDLDDGALFSDEVSRWLQSRGLSVVRAKIVVFNGCEVGKRNCFAESMGITGSQEGHAFLSWAEKPYNYWATLYGAEFFYHVALGKTVQEAHLDSIQTLLQKGTDQATEAANAARTDVRIYGDPNTRLKYE